MTIPLSKDFAITPNVVSPAGSALDANGLMLTDNELIPVGKVQSFYQDSDVSTLLGSTSKEYLAAQRYFSGYENSTVIPGELLMYRIVPEAVAGYLLSGSLKGARLAALQSLAPSTVALTVDGARVVSQTVDLSEATNYSGIASTLQAAIGAEHVSVEWLPVANRFIVRSATTGAESGVSFAADSTIATGLKLTSATAAMESPGSDAVTLTDTMDAIKSVNQNWIFFESLPLLNDEQQEELCAWTSSQNGRFGYSYWSESAEPTVANNASCFFQSVVEANGYEGVFPIYGDYRYGAMPLAYAASIDFARTNGRVSFKFRGFSGLAPNVSDLATANALESNGYNYYGTYSLNKTLARYASDGKISGKFEWIDTFVNEVWINANLVSAFTSLFTANQSYSFNAQGYAAVSAAVIDVAGKALNFGAIQTGVTLDQAQIRIINNTVGSDISSVLYAAGWYFYIPPQPGENRLDRAVKGAIFYYVDGGLIQSIRLSSTAVL